MSEKAAIKRLALGFLALLMIQLGTVVMLVNHRAAPAAIDPPAVVRRRLQQASEAWAWFECEKRGRGVDRPLRNSLYPLQIAAGRMIIWGA